MEGSGPDHDRHYLAEVYVAGERRGTGEGSSKKDAEQDGGPAAWLLLSTLEPEPQGDGHA